MASSITEKIAFIGSGHMAEAIIGGLLAAGVCSADEFWASDPVAARCNRLKSLFSIRVGAENRQAVTWADIVILAVKPQSFPTVLREIGAEGSRRAVIATECDT